MMDAKKSVASLLTQANIVINGNAPTDIRVHNERLYKRVFFGGRLGLGESYMDGWWDVEDLTGFFQKLLRLSIHEPSNASRMRVFLKKLSWIITNQQNINRSFRVGKQHYDHHKTMYEYMLGPTMQYSCAYWKDAQNLDYAQYAKMKLIADKLKIKPGMSILDVGCGWGSLALFLAKEYGAYITGLTISSEQASHAETWATKEHAKDHVSIELLDYRTFASHKQFDCIVSVGMFEHVGKKNYQTFFEKAEKYLKPDGRFLLHTIVGDGGTDPWIEKYIFPGGMLPQPDWILRSSYAYFHVEDLHNFGPYYAKTLYAWRENFYKYWDEISALNPIYNDRFKRMWHYYLCYCEAPFKERHIGLHQYVFRKKSREMDTYLRLS